MDTKIETNLSFTTTLQKMKLARQDIITCTVISYSAF